MRAALPMALVALFTSALGRGQGAVDAGAEPPVRYSRAAEPEQVQLGQPFVYTVVLTHPVSMRYELVPPKDLGAFDLLEESRARSDGSELATTTFTLKMALFELGKKEVPSLTFEGVGPAGTRALVVPGAEVEALSSLPKDAKGQGAELLDIKPPEDAPVRSYRLVWGLLAAALAGAAAYLVYRRLKGLRASKLLPVEPPLPLDVRTRRALDLLKAEGLPAAGRKREFFFRLSEIVRSYLGERYRFEALECTGPELIERAQRLVAPELQLDELRRFVAESDLVKFARAEASEATCEAALAYGYQLVERTTPALTDHALGSGLP